MKTFRFLLSLAVLFTALGCKTDAIDNFTIRLRPEIFDHTIMIEIYDANDPSKTLNNLLIDVTSSNALDIYEISGTRNFTTVDGRIGIGLHRRANPTPDKSVLATLRISADGYLTSNFNILFKYDQNSAVVRIPMVNIGTPPPGVAFNTGGATLQGGALGAPLRVMVPPGANSNTGMEVELPTGTQFFDANGNALTGSNLDVQIGYFDPINAESVESFPGDLSIDEVTLPGGNTGAGTFVTAGFTTINMEVDGVAVKTFSTPITVTIDIDANTINPNTQQPIQAGEIIPVWSYNEANDEWTYETDGNVIQGASGLQLTYQSTHLSWWNLDWFTNRCCSSDCADLQISMPGWGPGEKKLVKLRVVNEGTNQPVSSWANTSVEIFDGYTTRFQYASNSPVNIQVLDYSTNQILAQTGAVNLCSGTIPLTVTLPKPTFLTFKITGVCANKPNIQIRPSFWVYFRPAGSNLDYTTLGQVVNGQGSTSGLQINQTYDFRAYFNNTTIDTTVTINTNNYDIQLELGEYCDDL